MNTDAIRENLKRGTIDLLLLTLLRHSDKYGYELKNELYLQALSQEYFMMTEAIQNVLLYNEENKELSSADTERNQPIH